MTEIRASTILPARREPETLHTADGLALVGELAQPLDGPPAAPVRCADRCRTPRAARPRAPERGSRIEGAVDLLVKIQHVAIILLLSALTVAICVIARRR